MALTRSAAAETLARVESDPSVRERFLAAYTGDEDAVAALREVADPALPSPSSAARDLRLKSFERAAYGRATSPEDEAAAAHARDEIVWELDHRAALLAALEVAVRAAAVAPVEPSESTPVEPESLDGGSTDLSRRRLSTRTIVTIAVAAGLVLGVAIAVGLGSYFGANRALTTSRLPPSHTSTAHPTPGRTPVTSLVTRTYTTKQIAGWFAATSTSDDTFPQPSYLAFIGLGSSTTRFIATSDKGFSLWIGKSTTGETCLLMNGTVDGQQTGSASKCLSDSAIRHGSALVINEHGLNATLTTRDLVVAVSST